MQVVIAPIRLVVASARPAPGNKADAHVPGYPGTRLIVPHRRQADRHLRHSQGEESSDESGPASSAPLPAITRWA
ncbi:hypothetical protein OHB36_09080 [Streptomyces sp. NBC_00320]|nr:hypothetical protein [Streptomyces sp. NBC_00320]